MTTTQKLIKILAIALALVLIVLIFSGIISVIVNVAGVADRLFSDDDEHTFEESMTDAYFNASEISSLNIELGAAEIVFLTAEADDGDIVVFADIESVLVQDKNGTLLIKDKRSIFSDGDDAYISITIPKDMVFEDVSLELGAGLVKIDFLKTKTMDIDLGAAAFEASYLSVTKELEADLGTGAFSIDSGLITSPDFDLGVGKTEICAYIEGDGDFDCGIGELDLTIYASPSNYTIRTERGIGTITVDGESFSNGEVFGNGKNTLRINGGIGSIDISFLQD